MQRVIMKSKIHRATVTRADLDYEGSCGIAPELMRASAHVDESEMRDFASTIVHVDVQNRIREQAAIA
jgi:aspartate 1-decarboxylase